MSLREDLPARVRAAYLKAQNYKQEGSVAGGGAAATSSKSSLARLTDMSMQRELHLKD